MLWARLNFKEYWVMKTIQRVYTRLVLRSWTHCSSGRGIVLTTRQDALGLTPALGSRSLRRELMPRGRGNLWNSISLVLRPEAVTGFEGGCGRGLA